MRRLEIIGLAGLFVLLFQVPALADHASFNATGTIVAGHPVTSVAGGVSENGGACDPASSLNGIDGTWYDIQGFGGHTATLTMGENADFDAYWYDDSCTFIDDVGMAQGFLGATETSLVPPDARFVVVDLFLGANETFTLTIG